MDSFPQKKVREDEIEKLLSIREKPLLPDYERMLGNISIIVKQKIRLLHYFQIASLRAGKQDSLKRPPDTVRCAI